MEEASSILDDEWLVHNTLPLIFRWLRPKDLLNCAAVNKTWRLIALDRILWRSVEFNGNRLRCNEMALFLQKENTLKLKLTDCWLNNDLLTAVKLMPCLRHLELSAATLTLIEFLPLSNPNLEVIKANMICGFIEINLNFSFLKNLPNIRELKLCCNRALNKMSPYLDFAKNLQHLSLLGVKNLGSTDINLCKIGQYGNLKTLALGDCWNLQKNFGDDFLRSLTSLEKLRLESCRACYLTNILENLGYLGNLKILQLIDITAENNFENALTLCNQIDDLTIVPSPHRFKMAVFNYRILLGVTSLKTNLKKLTWGFTPNYMSYINQVCEKENCIPMPKNPLDIAVEPLTQSSFINLGVLRDYLVKEMVNTHVVIESREYMGSVFLE